MACCRCSSALGPLFAVKTPADSLACSNLLEYREMVSPRSLLSLRYAHRADVPAMQNLEDGTHIVSAARYDLMVKQNEDTTSFIPAHPDFRIIALGVPVRAYDSCVTIVSVPLSERDWMGQLPTPASRSTLPSDPASKRATSTQSRRPKFSRGKS